MITYAAFNFMKPRLPFFFFPFLRLIYNKTSEAFSLIKITSQTGVVFGVCIDTIIIIKLRKGKALKKHSMHGKKQPWFYWSCSSVVMKDAAPLTPPLFLNVNNIQSMIPENQKNKTTQWWSTRRHYTATIHFIKHI